MTRTRLSSLLVSGLLALAGCSAIVDSKLDDKRGSVSDEIWIHVEPELVELSASIVPLA